MNYLQCLIISLIILCILGTLKKNIVWIDLIYLFTILIKSNYNNILLSKSSVLVSDYFNLYQAV